MADSVVDQFPWLKNVDFYVTTACNGSCADCMAYDLMEEEGIRHMDKQLYFDVMDQLEGIDSVHFAGIGDPFVHPDIFEMMDYANERVTKGVRINTNGYAIPDVYGAGIFKEKKRREEAKRFFERLPKNTHIFLSFDKYHVRWMGAEDFYGRFCTLLEYSDAYDIDVTFNIRDTKKESVFRNLILQYLEGLEGWPSRRKLLDRYNEILNKRPVINRVLRMGKARNFKNARYVDLHKLLDKHIRNPMVGVMYDGIVVSNFIAAYFPKSVRPEACELGDAGKEPLSKILKKYEHARKMHDLFKDIILSSMIDDLKSYPFAVEDHEEFDWDDDALKDKKKKALKNTPKSIIESLYQFSKPNFPPSSFTRLISIDGKLRLELTRAGD